MVPHGQGAERAMRGEIRAEPLFLRRTDRDVVAAIEHDDVPRAQFIAVVASTPRPRHGAEIREIRHAGVGLVLVVPGSGTRSPAVPAPGWLIAVAVIGW